MQILKDWRILKLQINVKELVKRNELQHAGVKGMKWGVRKDTKEHTPKQQAKDQRKIDKKVMRNLTAKVDRDKNSIYKMSDDVIRQRVNRMELEKKYMNLSSERAYYHQSTGKKYLTRIKNRVTGNVIKNTENTAVKVGKNVTSMGMKKAAASITNPQASAAMAAFALLNKK